MGKCLSKQFYEFILNTNRDLIKMKRINSSVSKSLNQTELLLSKVNIPILAEVLPAQNITKSIDYSLTWDTQRSVDYCFLEIENCLFQLAIVHYKNRYWEKAENFFQVLFDIGYTKDGELTCQDYINSCLIGQAMDFVLTGDMLSASQILEKMQLKYDSKYLKALEYIDQSNADGLLKAVGLIPSLREKYYIDFLLTGLRLKDDMFHRLSENPFQTFDVNLITAVDKQLFDFKKFTVNEMFDSLIHCT